MFRKARNIAPYLTTILSASPAFSRRASQPWFSFTGAKDALSYYDTNPLRETLSELVDFQLINSRTTRFSVGAVNVRTGNFLYFDNHDMKVGPEHVMASGALPPALPMVRSAPTISGTAALSRTRRCNTSLNMTPSTTR